MRTNAFLSAAALAGIVAASPAPQQLDLAAILTAAPASYSGPALTAVNQTVTFDTAAQAASISAQVTSAASASITGAAATAAANLSPGSKRDLEKRGLTLNQLLALLGIKVSSTTSSATSTAKSTTSPTTATSASVKATSTTVPATTIASTSSSIFSSFSLTSSTTTNSNAGSASTTTSSTTACPTTPEEGTYCGFINPEDPCAPQPDGYGPVPTPDTVSAFLAYAPFQSMAVNAPTPQNYTNTFSNLQGSSQINSYIGLYDLTTYDTQACADHCGNTALCTSFNIYIERDPSQNPSMNDSSDPTVWGTWCPNPASITNYKCTLWGSSLNASTATNAGGWREQFQVVITGSNGYDSTPYVAPPAVSSYTAPSNCTGHAINGGNYWVGSKFFAGPYNPQLCADYSSAQSTLNKAAAVSAGKHSYTPCNMFNAYMVHKNGAPQGTYCSLYNTALSTSWATNAGSWSGRDFYGVGQSWTYSLSTPDTGRC